MWQFQSTRPVWGATFAQQLLTFKAAISIHAPRVGRDLTPQTALAYMLDISIHAPRVGRDAVYDYLHDKQVEFQSTRPVWGATQAVAHHGQLFDISIHAPRVGRDMESLDPTKSPY